MVYLNDMYPVAQQVVQLEPELSLEQRARLVEIAHETKVPEIREAALALVRRPHYMVVK